VRLVQFLGLGNNMPTIGSEEAKEAEWERINSIMQKRIAEESMRGALPSKLGFAENVGALGEIKNPERARKEAEAYEAGRALAAKKKVINRYVGAKKALPGISDKEALRIAKEGGGGAQRWAGEGGSSPKPTATKKAKKPSSKETAKEFKELRKKGVSEKDALAKVVAKATAAAPKKEPEQEDSTETNWFRHYFPKDTVTEKPGDISTEKRTEIERMLGYGPQLGPVAEQVAPEPTSPSAVPELLAAPPPEPPILFQPPPTTPTSVPGGLAAPPVYPDRVSGIAGALGLPGALPAAAPSQADLMAEGRQTLEQPGVEEVATIETETAVGMPPRGGTEKSPPGGKTAGTGVGTTSSVARSPRTSGLDDQVMLAGEMAGIRAGLEEGFGDYGGDEPETRADAYARKRKEQVERREALSNRFEGNINDARMGAQYPGMDVEEVKLLQGVLQQTFNPADYDSPEEADAARRSLTRQQASAKSRLRRAGEIQTDRAFGNIASKVIAALAIGVGAQAAAISGGKNVALDLYNDAISRDISAQRESFAHKRADPGRAQKEYAFLMEKLGNDEAATAATMAIQYDQAVQDLKKRAAAYPSLMESAKYKTTMDGLRQKAAESMMAAKKAKENLAVLQDTGIKGLRWIGGEKGKTDDLSRKTRKERINDLLNKKLVTDDAIRIINDYESALKKINLIESPTSADLARLKPLTQGLVSQLGNLWGKGVLQKEEYKQVIGAIPGTSYARTAGFFNDRSEAAIDALRGLARGRFKTHVDALTDFEYTYEEEEDSIGRKTGEKAKLVPATRETDRTSGYGKALGLPGF